MTAKKSIALSLSRMSALPALLVAPTFCWAKEAQADSEQGYHDKTPQDIVVTALVNRSQKDALGGVSEIGRAHV